MQSNYIVIILVKKNIIIINKTSKEGKRLT